VDHRLKIDPESLDQIDLVAAARNEASSPPDLLPAGIAEQLLREKSDELGKLLRAQLQSGMNLSQPEELPAVKAVRGRRPLALLPISQRVMFRALVETLAPLLPPLERGGAEFNDFKTAPLGSDGCRFVVTADVASCYQYVDHSLIQDELLAITGEPFITDSILTLLRAMSGSNCGLPQNRYGSHHLADLVLDIAERRVARDGFEVWRYNDDFRIASTNRAEAHEALERLEECLRSLGLTTNEEKTSIVTIGTYIASLDAAMERRRQIRDDVQIDLTEFTYDGDAFIPELPEIEAETCRRVLDEWRHRVTDGTPRFGLEAALDRQLVTISLIMLSALSDPDGLAQCGFILQNEPSLSPYVSKYLSDLQLEDVTGVEECIDSVIDNDGLYLNPWQRLWLLQPLKTCKGLSMSQESWLVAQCSDRSDYLRSDAALALAHHGKIPLDDVMKQFNVSSEAALPQLVAAAAKITGDMSDRRLRTFTRDRPAFQWVAQLALGHDD
jgi:hypothetical protein